MKAISLWQPWATLWLLADPDEKVFETRHWPTSYRGPLLVHAAKKRHGEVRAMIEGNPLVKARLALHGMTIDDLAYGALIGGVYLVGCSKMSTMPEPTLLEAAFGDWGPGRYAWKRGASPSLWKRPIPYKGLQSFFDVPATLISEAVKTGSLVSRTIP